jgi:hypothetical protein
MSEPTRCIAIGIYDAKGTLIRRIPIDENGKLAEPLEAIYHRQMVYAMIESEGRQIVAVPWMTKAAPALIENRWAAFTTEELESLDYELGERARNPLLTEIVAELARRKATDETQAGNA